MRIVTGAVLVVAMGAAVVRADCEAPSEPTLPDGASASMQDMLDGQESVKIFQTANLDYMGCLETAFTDAERTAKNAGDKAQAAKAMATYSRALDAYNTAVSKEERVAGEFNTQVRAYQTANAEN